MEQHYCECSFIVTFTYLLVDNHVKIDFDPFLSIHIYPILQQFFYFILSIDHPNDWNMLAKPL